MIARTVFENLNHAQIVLNVALDGLRKMPIRDWAEAKLESCIADVEQIAEIVETHL